MRTAKLKSKLAAARSAVQAAGVAIEKLRTSIAALKAERAAVAGVPLPIDQALDTLRRHLDNLASSAGSTLESVAPAARYSRRFCRSHAIRCCCSRCWPVVRSKRR